MGIRELDNDTLEVLANGSSVYYGNDNNQEQRISMAREILRLRKSPSHNSMEDFVRQATLTESADLPAILSRISTRRDIRLLHSAMGLVTESAELMDALKEHTFYGKPLDTVNILEEAGDLMWYLAVLFDELGTSFEQVGLTVLNKLRKRYHCSRFDAGEATVRDIAAERSVLEQIQAVTDRVVDNYLPPRAESQVD